MLDMFREAKSLRISYILTVYYFLIFSKKILDL